VIEVEEKENIEREMINWRGLKKKKIQLAKRKTISKRENFFSNPIVIYVGLDLKTNPLEEGENDEIINSLSM
jgi:hypothetical protein